MEGSWTCYGKGKLIVTRLDGFREMTSEMFQGFPRECGYFREFSPIALQPTFSDVYQQLGVEASRKLLDSWF
jgi:hypothetical protein